MVTSRATVTVAIIGMPDVEISIIFYCACGGRVGDPIEPPYVHLIKLKIRQHAHCVCSDVQSLLYSCSDIQSKLPSLLLLARVAWGCQGGARKAEGPEGHD